MYLTRRGKVIVSYLFNSIITKANIVSFYGVLSKLQQTHERHLSLVFVKGFIVLLPIISKFTFYTCESH